MWIARTAPLHGRVSPKLCGGTERIGSFPTEQLVHQGHDAALFAGSDPRTSGELARSRCTQDKKVRGATRDRQSFSGDVEHLMQLAEVGA